ncbi:unnamed protein product [Eruca vesicaria subsp. sativa]|uniref:Uncharacterized protein n=1 Tax=Eruca vesicaria subsp. sativa TaxID=29727 RepID=A0ABC8L7E7_ERUVS|nr:unnamed protein product [Eruca vesicaria subsp. sativa]
MDAELFYWEKEKAVGLYRRAAELGDPVDQCNLGISYLQVNCLYLICSSTIESKEAMKWLENGYNKWYIKAAEGGYVRAMYNVSLCYSVGEGLPQNRKLAGG